MSALSTHTLLVSDAERPPLILVHGARTRRACGPSGKSSSLGADGPLTRSTFAATAPAADLSATRMADYAADVVSLARTLRRTPVLVGWSMGGLVAMMAATACEAPACVGLAPSTPARTLDLTVPLRAGVFGPEEYGIVDRDPDHQPAMADLDRSERVVALDSLGPESRLARDERKAGVVVDVRCPLLIVTGTSDTLWPRHRYDALPFAADHVSIDGASHWGLVVNRRLLATMASAVNDWLGKALARGSGAIRLGR